MPRSAALVDELTLPLYYDGRMQTVKEWLGWFAEDELRRYPALAVVGAWLRVLTGRQADAERWLMLADGATSAIPLSDGSESIEPWVANLRACMMRDGAEQALADADLALSGLSRHSGWAATALVVRGSTELARAHLALADVGAARTVLSETERVLELRPEGLVDGSIYPPRADLTLEG